MWRQLAQFSKNLTTILALLSTMTLAFLVMEFCIEAILERAVVIEPISVPKALSDSGFTSEVVAEELRDAINRLITDARSSMRNDKVLAQADFPDVVVPTLGISVQTVASQVADFLNLDRRQIISGDLTQLSAGLTSFRLRLNGALIFTNQLFSPDPQQIDDLLEKAAEKVLLYTQPYFLASAQYLRGDGCAGDQCPAITTIESIVDDLPTSDEEKARAYNLWALILRSNKECDEAETKLQEAILSYPQFAILHDDLANVLFDLGWTLTHSTAAHEDAAQDATSASQYYNESKQEFEETIKLAPSDPPARFEYAQLLTVLGDNKAAEGQNKIYHDLSISNASLDYGYGVLLQSLGRNEEAAAQFKKAIKISPIFPEAYRRYGVLLRKLGYEADAQSAFDSAESQAESVSSPLFSRQQCDL